LRTALPGFVSVRGRVTGVPTVVLGKANGFGLNTNCGAAGPVPVPVSTAVWGDPVALSATEMLAVSAPVVVGVKVMVIRQALSRGRLAPQLLVWEKLLALEPVMEILEMVRAALPGLESAIAMVPDELPTLVLGKVTGLGLSVACGAGAVVPVPVKATVCGEPVALSVTESVALNPVADAGVKLT